MLTILHGENIQQSRNRFMQLKQSHQGFEIRMLDGKRTDETVILQAVESTSLFGEKILVLIENLFSSLGRKQKMVKTYATLLQHIGNTHDVILWEEKEMGKTVLSEFPNATVQSFPLPKILFEFLDAIKPTNENSVIRLYTTLIETEAPELIFYMITMRIRQLMQAKDGIIPERFSSWQYGRLTNQARLFTMEQLLIMHKNLLSIEYSIKSGTTPLTLTQHIKHFLIEI